ncbi:MAG: polyprenol monophosphomannose synthase [Firmicutes bacterium]|nr:polyprenol monophosphomannose synthase [Alicyclobacillaceae bacterium]MCL6497664.1 polyprenol monophosphomannose synthase [Bacillota bacterium]
MEALVILPTYNEVGNLGPLLEAILEQGERFDVLVIDDGSPDGTGLLAEHYKALNPGRIEVIHRQGKLGLATAYLAGFRYGLAKGYRYLFEMDADFSHPPQDLPVLLAALKETGADVVIGSRYVAGGGIRRWSWTRRWLSRGGSWLAGTLLHLPIRDLTGGFKCFRREVLEAMDLDQIRATGYGFQIEMTYRAVELGFRVVEVPIWFEERREGTSKMSAGIVAEALWLVARLRWEEGARLKREPKGERVRS